MSNNNAKRGKANDDDVGRAMRAGWMADWTSVVWELLKHLIVVALGVILVALVAWINDASTGADYFAKSVLNLVALFVGGIIACGWIEATSRYMAVAGSAHLRPWQRNMRECIFIGIFLAFVLATALSLCAVWLNVVVDMKIAEKSVLTSLSVAVFGILIVAWLDSTAGVSVDPGFAFLVAVAAAVVVFCIPVLRGFPALAPLFAAFKAAPAPVPV